MLRRILTFAVALCVAGVTVGASPATAGAYMPGFGADVDESFTARDQKNFRTGFQVNGLFGGEESHFLRYFDLGYTSHSGEYHIDLELPSLVLIADGLFTLSTFLVRDFPEPLFIMMNATDITSHWQLADARMGYRFLLTPPEHFESWTQPLETAVGLFATADLVFFQNRRGIEQEEASRLGYTDPLVIGGGGYLSVGQARENFQYDLSLAVGQGIRGVENNPDRRVTIVSVDADFQIEAPPNLLDFYIRPRLTGYITRLSPAINIGGGLSAGMNFGF